MTSTYLTPEACLQREEAFFTRLALEAFDLGPASITWPDDSQFWSLPFRVQQQVTAFAFRFRVRNAPPLLPLSFQN